MNKRKVIKVLIGFSLLAIVASILICVFAGLLMLLWNIIGVTALSNAVPLTLIPTLKGVGIFCGMVVLIKFIRSIILGLELEIKKQTMINIMQQQPGKEQAQGKDDNFLRYFHID